MRDLRLILGLLVGALRVVLWTLATIWRGGRAIWRSTVLLQRWSKVIAEVRFCPRGHAVAMYGLWDCHCGARMEGWAFASCPICGESAGYVSCPTCGLPIRSPFIL